MARELRTYTDSNGKVRTEYVEVPDENPISYRQVYNPQTRRYEPQ